MPGVTKALDKPPPPLPTSPGAAGKGKGKGRGRKRKGGATHTHTHTAAAHSSSSSSDDFEDEFDTAALADDSSAHLASSSSSSSSSSSLLACLTECMVCMQPCGNAGDHRVVSLPCGHLFGERCIQKWLLAGKKRDACCPSCNVRCKYTDLRPLFTSQIVVLDTSTVATLKQSMAEERKAHEKLKVDFSLLSKRFRAVKEREERQAAACVCGSSSDGTSSFSSSSSSSFSSSNGGVKKRKREGYSTLVLE
jgi:hypothetical protein